MMLSSGGPGPAGGGEPPKSNRVKRGSSSNPKQSSSCQLQLKVIRKSLERLMSERTQIKDIKEGLVAALNDLDAEIAKVSLMHKIANEAYYFQDGLPYDNIIRVPKRLEYKPDTEKSDDGITADLSDGSSVNENGSVESQAGASGFTGTKTNSSGSHYLSDSDFLEL